jgi:hypothetical protein
MAIAQKHQTKHKPSPKGKVRKPGARKPARAAEGSGPDRSAPPLAEIDADALEFIEAIDHFKKQHGRPFPSWSEVLMVLRQLGYSRR